VFNIDVACRIVTYEEHCQSGLALAGVGEPFNLGSQIASYRCGGCRSIKNLRLGFVLRHVYLDQRRESPTVSGRSITQLAQHSVDLQRTVFPHPQCWKVFLREMTSCLPPIVFSMTP